MEDGPTTSVHTAAAAVSISSVYLWRPEGERRPVRRKHKDLQPGDTELGVGLTALADDPAFLWLFLLTNEACFTRNGVFNMNSTLINLSF